MTDFVKKTCKLGQGDACCRYLLLGSNFECGKFTSLKNEIDRRVDAKAMHAKGDNCAGVSNAKNLAEIDICDDCGQPREIKKKGMCADCFYVWKQSHI